MGTTIDVLYTVLLAAWFGTVVAVNGVFIPALSSLSLEQKAQWIGWFFPRLFRTVTVAGGIIVFIGCIALFTGEQSSGLGRISFLLILFLFVFHVVVERKLRPMALSFRKNIVNATVLRFYTYLRVVPRFGLCVITLAFVFQLLS